MKRVLLLIIILVLAAGPAHAQGGWIAPYGDPSGTDCAVWDAAPALLPVYIFHHSTPGATASRFAVELSGGAEWSLVYLADNPGFPWVQGDVWNGITVCYNECLAGPILVTTINFFGQGFSPTCSRIEVVPHPAAESGRVEVVDCADNIVTATGGPAIVNQDLGCICAINASAPQESIVLSSRTFQFCETIPIENSSWGKIKALFE